MQGWLAPMGPESTATYWVRRAIVVGLLVVAIVIVSQLVKPANEMVATVATPSPTPQTSPAAASATPAVPEPTPTAPAPEIPPPECDPAALSLAIDGPNPVATDAASADFAITLTTSQAACVLDLGDHPVTLIVTSGADRIWASSDCGDWQPSSQLTMTDGQPAELGIGWPVRRSMGGCDLVDAPLGAGTYVATAMIADHSARFVLQLN